VVAVSESTIEALLAEGRTFPPPPEFAASALVKNEMIYDEAEQDLEGFWAERAAELHWAAPWEQVLDESDPPFYKWFTGGKLNVAYNCLDRHVSAGKGDKVAYYWEGEPGDRAVITYRDLLERVCQLANALRGLGVRRGDRVAIYLGMIPELPIAMLACARIGAPHSVVFGGFSSDALRDRIQDAQAKLCITQDGAWRMGSVVPLKQNADTALAQCPSIEYCVVVKRADNSVEWTNGRDLWWDDLVSVEPKDAFAESMDAEDMLYILYTSGTTAKPKGIVHTTGGYLTGVAATHRLIFDIHDDTVYWCAADIGWVTGHSYIVYGPLANATTSVIYEGAPGYPDKDRLWDIVERYKVNVLYTAPTAIRTFMKWGDEYPTKHDLSSLRLLGTVGEPINPEAWIWYQQVIGGGRCPVVDTWWQTETGMILITPLPGITTTKPGSATFPFPGVGADVVDEQGKSVPFGGGGYVVITRPWPAMLRTIYKDPERYAEVYWSRFPGKYFAGDGCKRDDEGYFWLLGRVDDVMNIAGHRISTAEVESALVSHELVAEAAVVGRSDPVTGQAIAAFVTLRGSRVGDDALIEELRNHVAQVIGPIAKPKSIVFTDDLPKTRSGKIMRRLLRDISEERHLGDVTTLANAEIVHDIAARAGTTPTEE
jgi:acetyl-CoA synthetase